MRARTAHLRGLRLVGLIPEGRPVRRGPLGQRRVERRSVSVDVVCVPSGQVMAETSPQPSQPVHAQEVTPEPLCSSRHSGKDPLRRRVDLLTIVGECPLDEQSGLSRAEVLEAVKCLDGQSA